MSIENIMKQIGFQIKTHNPDFIYFSSETFLSMNAQYFNIFVEEYKKIKKDVEKGNEMFHSFLKLIK
jgi:hypothetical protein